MVGTQRLRGMTTRTRPFTISPIDAAELDDVRTSFVDYAGTPAVDLCAVGGEPLRCCLRDARFGEAIMLFGYRPPMPRSPYSETGAVYVHRHTCAGPADGAYPSDWRGRPQVLRAYDELGWIHDASRTHDGTDPERELEEVLAAPGVVQVHSRNILHGCFMFVAVSRR